ncbi:Telomerase reverse transcriptase [Emydomyces testavorans]|uniref:Telomerase reverse transcriptase n=1 Tax=Emydomyces testavorans TaxID=2070801 RepID=A0AAF0IKQ9_9EURO|nr:Telomerase reverse transcriptase [Emydomyces testavorans]
MGNKRRHSPRDTAQSRPQKRVKTPEKRELKGKAKLLEPDSTTTAHPVLSCYYPRVIKLRSYLLELLPPTSKSRRRKVASLGTQSNIADCARSTTSTADVLRVGQSQSQEAEREDTRIRDIAKLLDTTLVGVLKPSDHAESQPRQRDFAAFTQSQFRSSLLHCTDVGATSSLSEIVDFTILTLFNQHRGPYSRPPHLLCHGFQRASSHCARNREHGALAGIPGVVPQYPNKNVSMLKGFPWTDVLNLLGANCEEIMLHLLLDCGLFISLDSNKGTYYQLSDLKTIDVAASDENGPSKENENVKGVAIRAEKALLSPKNIIFVRTRVLYARPALNARGEAKLGLQHIRKI